MYARTCSPHLISINPNQHYRAEDWKSKEEISHLFPEDGVRKCGPGKFHSELSVSWHCIQHQPWDPPPDDHMVIDPDIERGINVILDHVPNLQTLVLEGLASGRQVRPEACERTYQGSYLVGPKLGKLKELRLRGLDLGINVIALAMHLPKLEVLEVRRLVRNSEPIAEKYLGIRSTVKELHLGPFCKPNANMEQLFQWLFGLEKLSYDLGMYMGRYPPFGLPTLSRLLAPRINTLVDVNLSGADYSLIHMDNINFRLFSKLKKLTIANMLLFPCKFDYHQEQAPYRNGLFKRLPQSLEKFEVRNIHFMREFTFLTI